MNLGTGEVNLGTSEVNLGSGEVNFGTTEVNLGTSEMNRGKAEVRIRRGAFEPRFCPEMPGQGKFKRGDRDFVWGGAARANSSLSPLYLLIVDEADSLPQIFNGSPLLTPD